MTSSVVSGKKVSVVSGEERINVARHVHPLLYQVNARICLQERSRELGRQATLDDFPDQELDRIADLGFDWVWLLGIWQTGAIGRQISLANPEWLRDYRVLLPDFLEEDVTGSPFAITGYSANVEFGGEQGLLRIRERLRKRKLRLLLDFVPNHTACDHPWVFQHPEYYIRGTAADLSRAPNSYRRVQTCQGPLVFAFGRDPYFPGWVDTLQLNYRHSGLRRAMANELAKIAEQCDGLRCDMAMLVLPEIFLRTWGSASLPADGTAAVDTPFWPEVIERIRQQHPDFLFMAEVYWNLERTLQEQGFDYTYDKGLYDVLASHEAAAVRNSLQADLGFMNRLVHFLENHDERRAAEVFAFDVHQAAAIVAFLIPGMRFFYEGQLEGRRVRASIHLGRRTVEPVDPLVEEFYTRLFSCLRRREVRDGRWQLLTCRAAWGGNPTWERFFVFLWEGPNDQRLLATVNFGPTQGQCYVTLPLPELRGRTHVLRDLMSPAVYERNGDDLASRGLYLDIPAWGYNVFTVE